MDYRKLDAGLVAAMHEEDDQEAPTLTVFIHADRVPDDEAAVRMLRQAGVSGGGPIFTATLAPRAIAQLSDQPWVQSIKLSRRLHAMR